MSNNIDLDTIKVGNWPLVSCGQVVGWVGWITERLADAVGINLNRLRAAAAEVFPEGGYYVAKVGQLPVRFTGTYGGEFVGDTAS